MYLCTLLELPHNRSDMCKISLTVCPKEIFLAYIIIQRWMSKLWNSVIAPRVQEAILSRASVKRPSALGQTAAKKYPSQGQQAVVKAALSILLNKAVLHGCPLPRAGTNNTSQLKSK